MTESAGAASPQAGGHGRLRAALLLVVLLPALVFSFRDGLAWAARTWESAEYNHCYLIPFISAFLLATRARELGAAPWSGSVAGVGVVAFGFLLGLLGEFSSIATLSQYGFVIALWGCFLAVLGWQAVRTIWPALFYLVFLVPLPDFIQVKLSADLQLVSSRIGVAVVRLAEVPVYLEGNVIDLGNFQLAVAEACNGLRYLFPLLSFGFLCAVIYEAPLWQRAVVFFSAVPITVFMNSFRIGVIGILVSHYGIEQAEGFLHDFEGWAVFMVCVAILFLIMTVMSRLSGRRMLRDLKMDTPPVAEVLRILWRPQVQRAGYACVAVVLAGTALAGAVEQRRELVPHRGTLSAFPLLIGDWRGNEQPVERILIDELMTDDELMAIYGRTDDPMPVGLWIAYYASQREGKAVHSPATCLPGGGWQMQSLQPVDVPGIRADGGSLPVNRVVIAQGDERQLVYYWFAQRGRNLTNEYLVKWYIFWDGMTMNRSDGALVRLTTPVDRDAGGIERADRRLQDFARAVDPKLAYFLPQQDALPQVARAE